MTHDYAPTPHPSLAGARCNIAPSAVFGLDVQLGDDVSIGAGAVVLGPCSIGDRCVVAAGCVLDPGVGAPGSRLVLEPDVQLSAGVTIAARVTVSRGATVHPGTIVERAIPPHAIVSGNPAQIIGYAVSGKDTGSAAHTIANSAEQVAACQTSSVGGVTLHRLPRILDLRGNLTVGEFGRSIPFNPMRYFMVFGVPNAEIRGEHAHLVCQQFLICAHGSCHVVADDAEHREEFTLNDPAIGLYLPAMTWGIQYKYSADAVLVAFASEYYDNSDYIRDYDSFLTLAAEAKLRVSPLHQLI